MSYKEFVEAGAAVQALFMLGVFSAICSGGALFANTLTCLIARKHLEPDAFKEIMTCTIKWSFTGFAVAGLLFLAASLI